MAIPRNLANFAPKLDSSGNPTFTAPTVFSAGTVSAPSITFTGDTNTGIFSPGADITAFTQGGTERGRFNAAGYFKASYNGTYDSSTGSYHEFTGDSANTSTLFIYNKSASLTNYVTEIIADRNTTNNTYYFLRCRIAGVADKLVVADSGAIGTAGSITLGSITPATSGIGVQFPATQSASSNANTLDDYEEGTWTPNIAGNATYTQQSGTYTKIGRMVMIKGVLQINTIGTGDTFKVSGLPFSLDGGGGFAIPYFSSIATNLVNLGAFGFSNYFEIYSIGTAAASVGLNSIFKDGAYIHFWGCYQV